MEGSYYSVGLTGEWVVVKGHAAFFSGRKACAHKPCIVA